jgi:hypothetical protein
VMALWRARAPQRTLHQWLKVVELADLKAALAPLFAISEATAMPDDFVDLGQAAPFEVAQGEAECAQ